MVLTLSSPAQLWVRESILSGPTLETRPPRPVQPTLTSSILSAMILSPRLWPVLGAPESSTAPEVPGSHSPRSPRSSPSGVFLPTLPSKSRRSGVWDSAVPWLRPLENMEFAELIKTPRVDNVVLHRPFYPAVEGTLCLTGHHLILSSRQDNTEELWLLHSNIDAIDKR